MQLLSVAVLQRGIDALCQCRTHVLIDYAHDGVQIVTGIVDMVSKPTTSLALESGAAEDASVVDALPYIDGITADDRYQAEELIKEEVPVSPAPV